MIRYIVRKRFYFLAALFDSLMIPPTNSFEMRFEMFLLLPILRTS
jgi:hypothetical protein